MHSRPLRRLRDCANHGAKKDQTKMKKTTPDTMTEYYERFDEECDACRHEFQPDGILALSTNDAPDKTVHICEECLEGYYSDSDTEAHKRFDADFITPEEFKAVEAWAAREWVFSLKPDDLETVTDVKLLIGKMFTADINYHPDDSAETIIKMGGLPDSPTNLLFTGDEAKHMNDIMDAAREICDKAGEDLCGLAMDEIHRNNPEHFPEVLQWGQATDDMLSAPLPSGNTINIYHGKVDPADKVELSIHDDSPHAVTLFQVRYFDTIEQAKAAAPDLCREYGQFEKAKPEVNETGHVFSTATGSCVHCGADAQEAGRDCPERVSYDALMQDDEDRAILDCGCLLARCYSDDSVSITFCPLHKAAEELLTACKETLDDADPQGCEECAVVSSIQLKKIRRVIAQAEGKEIK